MKFHAKIILIRVLFQSRVVFRSVGRFSVCGLFFGESKNDPEGVSILNLSSTPFTTVGRMGRSGSFWVLWVVFRYTHEEELERTATR